MARLERLDERYRGHHAGEKQEFVFGGDERGDLLASLVGGPGKRVLDIGCRTGMLTRYYATGNDVTGVDVDRDALEVAANELGIATVWADAEAGLPFDNGSFDVVVAGEVLEHLADPVRVVADVRRVLRPGGRFVGSVPNAFRLKSRLAYVRGRYPVDWDPTHLQLFTPHALRELFAGFEDVRISFAVGRLTRLHPRLLANVQIFAARRPSTTSEADNA
ncbi:MAG TPA: methyltransferase domain-containing protein [Gaiellaceae bacterium]|nr:methyltransferase domain-containing protein [Gaiellaceae bacterium]